VLRGVSTFGTTFLGAFFLGFATTVFFLTGFFLVASFLTGFFLAAGFLGLALDLLAVLAVFFFVVVDFFLGIFLPPLAVAFFVVAFFTAGYARGLLREKKRGWATITREGRVAEDDDEVGSRPTRFVSALRAGRRARAWRTNKENIAEGVAAPGRKKTKPSFDGGANNGTNAVHFRLLTTPPKQRPNYRGF
jgi:hypothetical protein